MPHTHMKYADRIRLETLYREGKSVAKISENLSFSKSTIYRELSRGYYTRLTSDYREERDYSADIGQQKHDENAKNKGIAIKLGHDYKLANFLEERIAVDHYSPAAALKAIRKKKKKFRTTICEKTLYNYIDSEVFLKITNKDLPRKGKRTEHRTHQPVHTRVKKPLSRGIEERPEEVESRETFGHWEMDTVVGKAKGKGSVLLVLTERKTRQEIIEKMSSKTQESVKRALDRLERRYGKLFRKVFKTITVDNGGEFLSEESIEKSCRTRSPRTRVYYCHPYSSWERGSNENANAMIRRFIPKGSPIEKYTTKEIKWIENWMNEYPRKILGYESSSEVFERCIAEIKEKG